MLAGGCFCGDIRYQVDSQPTHETNCHCTMCRRTSGAPFVAWFTVERTAFQWTAGAPTGFASSDHAQRTFCPRCGASLTFETTREPELIDVTISSLDDPQRVAPLNDIHTSSKLSWVSLDDRLPSYKRERS